MENVVGLINTRLRGKQDGIRIIGGIEAGVLKFIIRSLTSLGCAAYYQNDYSFLLLNVVVFVQVSSKVQGT